MPERDGARLLVLDGPNTEHSSVLELARWIEPGTLCVVNDTRVVPARVFGTKADTGGKVELLLLGAVSGGRDGTERWRALGRSSKPLRPGAKIVLGVDESLAAQVVGRSADDPAVIVVDLETRGGESVRETLDRIGHVPLPPYLGRPEEAADRERYQTIFAHVDGAVAAPTAGLHLTDRVLSRLADRGVRIARVTLHVGLGTFQPVTADDFDDHAMHSERFAIPEQTCAALEEARREGRAVLAIGTTVVRALESAADREGHVQPTTSDTRLLIQPGYRFRVVDQLMTNFHLPRSTLLALVSAFGGRERVLAAYDEAVRAGYRFYSYGDAMLLRRCAAQSGGTA